MTVDFSEVHQEWKVQVDGVMGGLSTGKKNWTGEELKFTGEISLKNNGGFSALRSPFEASDLSPFSQVAITYRSTGIPMAFVLERSRRWYDPTFRHPLELSEKWTTIKLDFKDFESYQVGEKRQGRLDKERLESILRMGFISNAKREGAFVFEIKEMVFS